MTVRSSVRKPLVNYAQKRRISRVLHVLAVLIVTLLFVAPLYISFIYSLKTPAEIGTTPPLSLPRSFYMGNYVDVVTKNDLFQTGFVNSLICTIVIVTVLTVVTPMASYVLARSKRRIYTFIYYIFMTGILIPYQCIMFPSYVDLKAIGLINTLPGFMIVRTGFSIGMCVLITTNFVKSVPEELEEASSIDGASIFQTFWRIVYPLMKPINMTMLVLNTLNAWNDYSISITVLQSNKVRTMPLAQLVYTSESGVDINLAFAFFTLSMMPVLVLYLFTQRYIVSGIMSGAVKG